jgi:predicted glycoside hydrolase/deacetylase ChbG (UPF0249 family)
VIVNADDFGLDEATNRGVAAAFERGLVSSTTLMANHPGFEDAVELAHELRLASHVGVHIVLTSGSPLTEPILRCPRFCDPDGAFRNWRVEGHLWRAGGRERDAVAQEVRAQLARVRAAGLPVTHFDSHHHVHNELGIAGCVFAIARETSVRRIRLARNCGPGIGGGSSMYKRLFNWRLQRLGFARTRWFGGVEDWLHLQRSGVDDPSLDDFELMTHPSLDAKGRLVDAFEATELAALLAPVAGIRSAVSYAGTRYS